MNALLLTQDAPVLLSGIGAVVLLTAAPVFRTRRTVLLTQLAAGACFAAHYSFLGVTVAAAVNMLGLLQTGAALFSTRNSTMTWLGYGLIVQMILVCLAFWQGPISALSMIAMVLIAFGRMQSDQVRLRILLLVGGSLWILHDFLAEAWIALAADIGAFVLGSVALASLLVRIRIEWRPAMTAANQPAV